ncbi:hypothetical protein BD413DRAFT_497571 [Trametes elegans]|nr:hypothetical protein BD413DRAFT_497571 [Trametes elegans]
MAAATAALIACVWPPRRVGHSHAITEAAVLSRSAHATHPRLPPPSIPRWLSDRDSTALIDRVRWAPPGAHLRGCAEWSAIEWPGRVWLYPDAQRTRASPTRLCAHHRSPGDTSTARVDAGPGRCGPGAEASDGWVCDHMHMLLRAQERAPRAACGTEGCEHAHVPRTAERGCAARCTVGARVTTERRGLWAYVGTAACAYAGLGTVAACCTRAAATNVCCGGGTSYKVFVYGQLPCIYKAQAASATFAHEHHAAAAALYSTSRQTHMLPF